MRPTRPLPLAGARFAGSCIMAFVSPHNPRIEGAATITVIETA
jgi:hypothetical protein